MKLLPLSPHGLIQEQLYPNEWLVLVSCIMLNQTQRKQVERVLPEFIRRWSTPAAFLGADRQEIIELIKPLGFYNRRTDNLLKMTERFVAGPWEHANELPGIGEYGAACWEMFFTRVFREEPPKDHALVAYHSWWKKRSEQL